MNGLNKNVTELQKNLNEIFDQIPFNQNKFDKIMNSTDISNKDKLEGLSLIIENKINNNSKTLNLDFIKALLKKTEEIFNIEELNLKKKCVDIFTIVKEKNVVYIDNKYFVERIKAFYIEEALVASNNEDDNLFNQYLNGLGMFVFINSPTINENEINKIFENKNIDSNIKQKHLSILKTFTKDVDFIVDNPYMTTIIVEKILENIEDEPITASINNNYLDILSDFIIYNNDIDSVNKITLKTLEMFENPNIDPTAKKKCLDIFFLISRVNEFNNQSKFFKKYPEIMNNIITDIFNDMTNININNDKNMEILYNVVNKYKFTEQNQELAKNIVNLTMKICDNSNKRITNNLTQDEAQNINHIDESCIDIIINLVKNKDLKLSQENINLIIQKTTENRQLLDHTLHNALDENYHNFLQTYREEHENLEIGNRRYAVARPQEHIILHDPIFLEILNEASESIDTPNHSFSQE